MKFKNISGDTLDVPALTRPGAAHLWIAPGEFTPDLTDEEAVGFESQTDVWAAETTTPAAPAEPAQEAGN